MITDRQVKAVVIVAAAVLVFSGMILGRVVSVGDTRLGIIVFGAVFGFFLLGMPLVVVWLCVLNTLVFCGLIVYNTTGLDSIWWISYILGAILFVPVIFQSVQKNRIHREIPASGLAAPIIAFFLVFLLSVAINSVAAMQLLVAIKMWVLMAGIMAYFSLAPIDDSQLKKILLGIFIIALIQIFPVLYQFIFVKSELMVLGHMTVSSDSVVGTFGGSPTSGGMTGALAAFLVFNFIMLLSAKRYGLVNKYFGLYFVFLLLPMLLIEVKALFVFLPVAIMVLYKDLFIRDPLRFFKVAISGFLGLVVLLFSYQAYHWADNKNGAAKNIEHMFSYSFARDAGIKQEEGVMTRVEVITFWWEKHRLADPIPLLFGHGPASSKSGGMEIGDVAKKYEPRAIDRTGLALILWDFGLVGLVVISWLFWRVYRLAKNLRRMDLDVWDRSIVHGMQAIVPVLFLAMLYRNDIPYAPPMMLSLMVVMGVLIRTNRKVGRNYLIGQ